MNILIVTPLEPTPMLEIYLTCTNYMHFNNDIFFSIPAMALLGEETLQDSALSYEELLKMFLHSFSNTSYGRKIKNNEGNNICIGTMPKDIGSFDHIVSMVPPYLQDIDYKDSIATKIDNIYTLDDAELTFPTYHHLEKFLDLFALPRKQKEEKGDISELQSKTTNSSGQQRK